MIIDIKGTPGKKDKAQNAFDIANGYFEGALRCARAAENPYEPGAIVCVMSPTITCVAFSAEMYMKSLVLADGKIVLKVHRFDKLFTLLGTSQQQAVRKRFRSCTGVGSLQVAEHIKYFANAFVDWRYSHENPAQIRLDYLSRLSPSHTQNYLIPSGRDLG